MNDGRSVILRSDARSLPLADSSVDLVVTSPPYFALRSYTDGGEHYDGQIGAEPTPREYIAALVECTREWARVLKPGGSIWVNLGDKYAGAPSGPRKLNEDGWERDRSYTENRLRPRQAATPNKSLMLLPERYRIACVDELGLIARAVVVWSKPNALPESVTDRVRRSHEDWVHLTKAPRYYSAVDTIRTPHTRGWAPGRNGGTRPATVAASSQYDGLAASGPNALGALPGSVWEVPTEPLTVPDRLGVDHFAAFPTEWPRRIILGWSPSGICVECGEGRSPAVERDRVADRPGRVQGRAVDALLGGHGADGRAGSRFAASVAVVGEVCTCTPRTDHPGTGEHHRSNGTLPVSGGNAGRNVESGSGRPGDLGSGVRVGPWREYHRDRWTPAPTRPAVVLDPFGGTGTTALVAAALGRLGISVDMSADYCRLATWRTTDPGQMAKARGLPKPKVQAEGQGDLFADLFDGAA